MTEAEYILGRRPDRTYVSKTFPLDLRASRDEGQPARYIYKVFDEDTTTSLDWTGAEVTENLIFETPAGRKQIKLMVAREAGRIRELLIQRVTVGAGPSRTEVLLKLDRAGAARLVSLVRGLDHISVDGNEPSVRVDDVLLEDLFRDPDALAKIYQRNPSTFRHLIESDTLATDVVAVANRREVVARFKELLEDEDAFEAAKNLKGCGTERVWQDFFEDNPWILGAGTPGQLLTSWSEARLEQVVAGFSIGARGKRVDALLRTGGPIKSLVFAEIKHHRTPLLSAREYRPDCWAASTELGGGVTQAQQTVYNAVREIGERLPDIDGDGTETGESSFLVRPRSLLIAGRLSELRTETGVNLAKFRCFELYRRNLYEPEVVTFDELLARATWHVEMSARS